MPEKKKSKKTQNFLVVFARILATITIIGVILVLIPLSLPRFLGYETFNVVSGSMEPELPVGSLILVKPIEGKEVKEGDIITFNSNGTVISHRVVNNNTFEGKFKTKGDANENEDFLNVGYDQLIGIVSHHIPVMGAIGAYISTASGKLLIGELIICAVLMYVISGKIKR